MFFVATAAAALGAGTYALARHKQARASERIDSAVEKESTGDESTRLKAKFDRVEQRRHKIKEELAAAEAALTEAGEGLDQRQVSIERREKLFNERDQELTQRFEELKERRRLVLVPRETPLHTGHCELLLKASQMGAIMAPPMPAHYTNPQTVDDLVDHHVGRLLDLFDLDSGLVQRWQGPASKQS